MQYIVLLLVYNKIKNSRKIDKYFHLSIFFVIIKVDYYIKTKEENMGTYNLPRNVKGEGRILFIFSTKSLVTTCVGGAVGLIFYFIFSIINLKTVGIVITLIFALIGYTIGMFKIPDTNGFELTRKAGGENIDDIIKRYIKFKKNNKKLYVYTKEDKIDE
mgnify:CR=1 FL=1